MPSNLPLNTQSTVGFNNSLKTASSDMKLENNKSVNLEIESVGVRHMNGGSSKIHRPRSEGWRPLAGSQKPCISIEKADHRSRSLENEADH